MGLTQVSHDKLTQQINGCLVVAPLRHNQIGITLGRFNKLQMHGFYSFFITTKYLLHGSSPFRRRFQ